MNEKEEPIALKPVVFIRGKYDFHRNNVFQQNLLFKALKITSDPQELKKMLGLKRVADVYRTLDKIALRKEYHQALQEHGLDFSSIVKGIKDIAENGSKDSVRLSAWKVFLKSLGLEDYKEEGLESQKTWEDVIKELSSQEDAEAEVKVRGSDAVNYEVNEPEIPAEIQEDIDRENKDGRSLYGEN